MKNFKNKVFSLLLVCALIVTSIAVTPSKTSAASTAITNLKFQENTDGTCTISWDKIGNGSYNVYRADSRYSTYTKIDTTSENSYQDKNYDDGYYKVQYVQDGKEYEILL